MSVENSPLESFEYGGPQFLHVIGQKNDIDYSRHQHVSNRRVQRGRIRVGSRRQMNGPNAGGARLDQRAGVAIVAHHH